MGTRSSRFVAVLGIMAAAGAVAGCSAQPGTAGVINGVRITESELSDATLEFEALTGQDTAPSAVLTTLMLAQVFQEVGPEHGIAYTDEEVAGLFEQQAALQGAEVPEDGFSEAFIDLGHYLFGVTELQSSPDAAAVGEKLSTAMNEADIEVNPRYGEAVQGVVTPVEHDWIAAP
ncbi:hypothetical protein [Georgenia sp. AZ-5]|uniref:hypothetical protein n=1 Tax=Georgenia sp. AZ-5 TaxID=3367526 RepID=UPI0037542937